MSTQRSTIKYKYGSHERQRITHYQPTTTTRTEYKTPLIFIHGGAWIDVNNTDSDFDDFGINLLDSSSSINDIYSIDYRLTPEVKRPVHIQDIIKGIRKIELQSKKISLVGHSVGVTMVLELLSLREFDYEVEKLYLLDGIYEVELFKKEYPKWAFFIDDAGYEEYYIDFEKLKTIKDIYIVQSFKDELLSMKQTNWFIERLNFLEIGYTLKVGDFGNHDNVYHNKQVADLFNKSYKK